MSTMPFSSAFFLERAGRHGYPIGVPEMGAALALVRLGFARLASGRLHPTPEGMAAVRALPYPAAITMPETSSRPKAPTLRLIEGGAPAPKKRAPARRRAPAEGV